MTAEQMCRDLLARAYRDGVLQSVFYTGTADDLSAGDLTGMANLLAEFLRREAGAERERAAGAVDEEYRVAAFEDFEGWPTTERLKALAARIRAGG